MTTRPTVILRALVLALGLAWGAAATAAEAKKSYNVPAGEAAETLKQLAKQAGQQVVFPAQDVRGVKTAGVLGEYTLSEALARLLADTGLEARFDEKSGTFAVSKAGPNAERAAQTDRDRPGDQGKVEDGKLVLDKFEVFGTKSINADLPRSRDDVQPYVVFSRDQLQASPAANIEEFFRTRLPMNQGFSTGTTSAVDTTSLINLRGLGTNQTLILLDGRRLPPRAGAGGTTSQADINGIPLGMIERIEVLPTTASGIYGGSATGGVINIITRKDYSGVEVAINYQNTFGTDAATRRLDVNGSFALEDGRTMVTLNYSRSDSNSLLVQDRDFATRSRALLLANNPAAFTGATTPPAGYLANIRNQTGANLVLKPQFVVGGVTALNSPITFVPAGYAGPTTDGAGALLANAGRYDLNQSMGLDGSRAPLRAPPSVESFGLSLRRRFGKRVEAYVDASRMKNDSVTYVALTPRSTTIAANAPNNPFTTAITVSFPDLFSALPSIAVSRSDRLAAGAMLRLPAGWSAGADYVYSRSKFGYRTPLQVLGDPDGTGPGISYATALSTGVLNVLRDLYATPLDYGPYLMPNPYNDSRAELVAEEWTLRGSGSIATLPAGPLALSASVQWRDERIPDYVQTFASAANPTPSYIWHPSVGLKAWAYYAELRVPIFSPQSQVPLVRSLEFQASVRRDDLTMRARADRTSIFVPSPDGPFPTAAMLDRDYQATKATAGLKYTLNEDLTLRASFGTGFLPPSLQQLSPAASSSTAITIIDPRRGNTAQTISPLRLQGGSPDLEPEVSESTSAGVVFTPRFAPGLRLSVDYTRIVKTNEIGNLAQQTLLDLEALFPDRVVRAPLSAADQALGYTGGVITQLNLRSLNLAGKRLEAWDVQADYTWKPGDWGEFQAYAVATWQPHLEVKSLTTVPWVETAGYYLSAIKLRGSSGLNWTRGSWTLGWNTQYTGSYYVYMESTAPAARATAALNQGSATIKSRIYHDLSMTYRWGSQADGWQRFLKRSQITLGVQNVFDTSPPILANLTPFGASAYSNVGDPRLRRYTISLRKQF